MTHFETLHNYFASFFLHCTLPNMCPESSMTHINEIELLVKRKKYNEHTTFTCRNPQLHSCVFHLSYKENLFQSIIVVGCCINFI